MRNPISVNKKGKFLGLIVMCLCGLINPSQAQTHWEFPIPTVDTGPYAITDTVYMSPTGDDNNPGTQNQPVATFQKALQLLPFGTAGVNGGHAYGLIRLLPGRYVVSNGMEQSPTQYQQGNTFKNVSVEGIGDVTVGGTRDSFAAGHLIRLRGSHIFIKNLKLRFGQIHGVYLSDQTPPIDNVLIDGVEVDSVKNFGMLIRHVDTVLVRNSKSLYSSRPGTDTLTSGCQWPSGLKFYGCSWATIHDSEVAYSRGEGLNFHNSEYGLAYDNDLHDNPTNLYCDNSARIVIRNNFNYATPGHDIYWRTCPADTNPQYGSKGILLANEGACSVGGPVYQNCASNCTFEGRIFPHIDSIFIYNNFFINTTPALNMWQGTTNILGEHNCVRNVFFHHNTVVGVIGDAAAGNSAMIYGFFPNFYNTVLNQGFAIGENINLYGNIVSYDVDQYPGIQPIRIVRHNTIPVPFELKVAHNRWVEPDDEQTATDVVDTTLPSAVDPILDSILVHLQPCMDDHPNLVQSAPYSFLEDDYLERPRGFVETNVGALEYQMDCTSVGIRDNRDFVLGFKVSPNPGQNLLSIQWNWPVEQNTKVSVVDMTGRVALTTSLPAHENLWNLDVTSLASGLYIVMIQRSGQNPKIQRWVKQ